jgi:hypothetical protein
LCKLTHVINILHPIRLCFTSHPFSIRFAFKLRELSGKCCSTSVSTTQSTEFRNYSFWHTISCDQSQNFNSDIMVLDTFNFFISRASSSTLLVPTTLVATADRRFSSNRTVAAPWNTWLTSSISKRRSDVSSPKPGRLQSPFTIMTLWRNLGI